MRIRVRPNHIFAISLAALAVLFWLELERRPARNWLNERIYGHAPHGIPCRDWPAPQDAEKALADNAETVRALADAGLRLEIIVAAKCVCKAQFGVSRAAGVYYSEVKTIIGDRKRLFGIPYIPLDDSAADPRRCERDEETPDANFPKDRPSPLALTARRR